MSKSPGGELNAPPARVLLVDDHAILRLGLRALLEAEPGLEVVGDAASGEAGEALARELRPDLVLMDVTMPGCGGIEATARIRAEEEAPRVLILTMRSEAECLVVATQAGASGFVRKDCEGGELVRAIRAVADGQVYFNPTATRLLVQRYRQGGAAAQEPRPIDLLSARERQVLARVAEGYTSGEIGLQLQISSKTVDSYRERVMRKLGLEHRSEMVRLALQHKLVSLAA